MTDEVLYEEVDRIAIVAINRPEKKNTLTENVVRGVAEGVDTASRSKDVAAIVLRGVGDTFAAGYDLTDGGTWDVPYGAPDIETREGAWDPVRDRHRSKCGNSSLHTRAGLSRGTQCSGSGVSNDARARQRPWISAVSARADNRAA